MPHSHELSAEMRQCIENCLACHAACTETTLHCLSLGGEHAEPKHIRLMLDCAQICATSADFLLRTSHYHSRTCGVCAEICNACAKECDEMAGEDPPMKACAEACRKCAESCGAMAQG